MIMMIAIPTVTRISIKVVISINKKIMVISMIMMIAIPKFNNT